MIPQPLFLSLKLVILIIITITLVIVNAADFPIITLPTDNPKIVYGSCHFQERDSIFLPDPILNERANIFIFGGDNGYFDQGEQPVTPTVIENGYKALKKKLPSQPLGDHILAITDDHDTGTNDADKTFIYRNESKELFLKYMMNIDAKNDVRFRSRPGVYSSHMFITPTTKRKIHILLLDVRYNRDPWNPYYAQQGAIGGFLNVFIQLVGIFSTPNGTILGQEQWKWFEDSLCSVKDDDSIETTIVVSGIQMLHVGRGAGESWSLFPHEREKLLQILGKCKARGVLLLSGDVHFGEISEGKCASTTTSTSTTSDNKKTLDNNYVVEITSSGLTHSFETGTVVERPSTAFINVFLKYLMRFCRAIMPWRWATAYTSDLNYLSLSFDLSSNDKTNSKVQAKIMGPPIIVAKKQATPVIIREWKLRSLDRSSSSDKPCYPIQETVLDYFIPVFLQLYAARAWLLISLLGLPIWVMILAIKLGIRVVFLGGNKVGNMRENKRV
jgi:alkaline phosphatase D